MRSGQWVGALALLVGALLVAPGCKPDELGPVAPGLGANPRELPFGPVGLGQFRTQRVALTNVSRTPLHVSSVSSTVASIEVAGTGDFTLSPGQSREFEVRFAPAVEGDVSGHLVVETDLGGEGGEGRIPMSGRGVRSYVEVAPKLLDFGPVELDTNKVLTVEAHNPIGVDAVFHMGFSGDDADAFSSSEAGRDVAVGPGETHQIPISFRPERLGLAQSVATIVRCPTCEPEVVSLIGEGVAAMLEIFPTRLDFGRVSLGGHAELRITIRNNGNTNATFHAATITQGEGIFRRVEPVPPERDLAPGESMEVTVAFFPPANGTYQGILKLDVTASNESRRAISVRLTGEGGATCLTFLPRLLDFGTVPEGMSLKRDVFAFNKCQEDVTLNSLTVNTTAGGFFSLATAATSLVVPRGDKVPVTVAFTPRAGAGTSEGELVASVRQGSTLATEAVALRGASRVFAPCQYRVDPLQLPFGRVQVGSSVSLGVAITNVGTDDCFVSRMGLSSGSDAAFSADAFQGGVVAPGTNRLLAVKFAPSAVGSFAGLVEAVVNHPTLSLITVPVSGEAVQGCFTLEPGTVDFGTLKLSCGPRQRQVVAINRCAGDVTLTEVGLEAATSDDLGVTGVPGAFRYTLGAGQQATFTVTYTPDDEGGDSAALRVTSAEQGTLTVGLLGSGLDQPTQTDRFMQETQGKVDVLFVVDNSGSMMEEQQSLGQNFAAFLTAAQGQGVDYHVGVTTSGIEPSPGGWSICPGGVDGGEAGRLFPADNSAPRIITPQTPNAAAVFANNTKVGVCHWNEQGLEAAYRALSAPLINSLDDPRTPQANDGNGSFLRADARLAIIVVTDEEDFSAQTVPFYETFFKGLKNNDPNMFTFSAIVGPTNLATCPTASSSGTRYLAIAQATGGAVENICTPDWSNSLKKLSDETFGLKSSFALTKQPVDPAQISVVVNGVPYTSGWTYDAARNSVDFAQGFVPPSGALVEITYPLGC